jgi:glycosidase
MRTCAPPCTACRAGTDARRGRAALDLARHASNDTTSILSLVRSLIHYRRQNASLSEGEWRLLSRESDVFAYERGNGDDPILVVLDFTSHPRVWFAPTSTKVRVVISTHDDRRAEAVGSTVSLRANEGLLIEST